MTTVNELVRGAIDMHVHFGPDAHFGRRLDGLQTAQYAQEIGLKAIVLKSHDYPTAALATIIGSVATQVKVFGALCLDFETGGINVPVVETSAKLGAKVIWMPTSAHANSRVKMGKFLGLSLKGEGILITGGDGELLPEIKEILAIIREHDMIVATGHISPRETFKLVDFCEQIKLTRIIITHPSCVGVLDEALTIEEQQQLAKRGTFIEHTMVDLMPLFTQHSPKEDVAQIQAVGAEHCIISSDFGMDVLPPAPEGLRMFIATLLRAGMSEKEVELMAKVNPSRLLGLG